MQTVTADTNILVSGLHFGGKPRQFLNLARAGRFRLAISPDIQGELRRVLRDKLGWEQARLDEMDARLADFTIKVNPTQRLQVVRDDPDDDQVIECAVASGSSVIISGDRHLLNLGQYQDIPIMRVADFLRRMQEAEQVGDDGGSGGEAQEGAG
ncbi:putative toxin-antitoxin system toxin component, PIN family [soil metagenome]